MDKRQRKKHRKELEKDYSIDYSFVKILTGSDLSRHRLPLMSVRSIHHGPVIWLTACVHGDEVGGIVIIQELFKKIQKKQLLKGAVYAFPLMNPIGFETASRHITLSGEDLNRSFMGDINGSLAERIADKIFHTIIEKKPTLVLDLHNDWRKSIPYALLDPNPGSQFIETYDRTKLFSRKLGLPVVLDTDDVEHTLTYNLLKHHIPALTLELGESYVVNETDVEHGVNVIWNILKDLEMVPPEETTLSSLPERVKGNILWYSPKPFSHTSGIIRFLVKPGDMVHEGQPIAKIYNTFGRLLETMCALDDALVLGYSDSSVAFPGRPLMAFGII